MKEFIEVQNWGLNLIVLSSLMTVVFTIIQGYGFIKQGQKIWREKSAKAISPQFFFLFFFYFLAFIFYGISKLSLAMAFNGLLFLTCIPVVVGVIKFKKLKVLDWISFFSFMLIVPAMILLDNKDKDILTSSLLLVSLIVLLIQLFGIIKEKSTGSMEIKFIIIFFSTSVCWLVYSFLIGNWPLQIFNSFAAVIYLLIILLYRKYNKKRK